MTGAGGPAAPPYLHPALLYFHGIAAVGLAEGRVLLVDLGLDEPGETSDSAPAGDDRPLEIILTRVWFTGLCFLSGDSGRDVGRVRRAAVEAGTQLALEVAGRTSRDQFHWEQGVAFPSETVQVSIVTHHNLPSSVSRSLKPLEN